MVTRNVSDSASEPVKGARTLPYQGLTSHQVKVNRQQYGANILTPPERTPWWMLFLEKFADPVIRILMIAAVIAISVGMIEGEYAEGLGIVVAILLATTLAFINEYKASQEFEILNQVYDEVSSKVIRDGNVTSIPRKELVVGDIVYIEQGGEIPADGEVLEEVSLYLDQSKLTGESEPVKKYTKAKAEVYGREEATYPPYKIYRGTIVDQGEGLFELTAVGDQTEIGKVAMAVATVESGEQTPLNVQLERLSKLIGVVGLSFSGLTFNQMRVHEVNFPALNPQRSDFKFIQGFVAEAIAARGSVFRTVPLSFSDWITITAGTSIVLWLGELWRLMIRLKSEANLEKSRIQVS